MASVKKDTFSHILSYCKKSNRVSVLATTCKEIEETTSQSKTKLFTHLCDKFGTISDKE